MINSASPYSVPNFVVDNSGAFRLRLRSVELRNNDNKSIKAIFGKESIKRSFYCYLQMRPEYWAVDNDEHLAIFEEWSSQEDRRRKHKISRNGKLKTVNAGLHFFLSFRNGYSNEVLN